MKNQKLSNLSHRKMCLQELRTLYRQLLMLSRHNQFLCNRKYYIDQNLLLKNEKLQVIIKEKIKTVHKYIERITELIRITNVTKQHNLVEKPITISEPENIIQKNIQKSLYTKVTSDTTHWLKVTTTPTVISPTEEKGIQSQNLNKRIRENNTQTTSVKKMDKNNENLKATTQENRHLQKNKSGLQDTFQKDIVKCPLNKVNKDTINLSQRLGKSTLTLVPPSASSSKLTKGKDAQTQTKETEKIQQIRETKDAQVNTSCNEIDRDNQNSNTPEPANSLMNNMYYDSGIHWCSVCNVFPATIHDYLEHLHSPHHSSLLLEKNLYEKPWEKEKPLEAFEVNNRTPKMKVLIEGVQFLVPCNGYYCKLCSEWIGDLDCANSHLRSYSHLEKYSIFINHNPNWKIDWLMERTLAYEQLIAANCHLGEKKIGVKVECFSPSPITNESIEVQYPHLNSLKEKKHKAKSLLSSTSNCSSDSKDMFCKVEHQIKNLVIPEKNRKGYKKISGINSRRKRKYEFYQVEHESSDSVRSGIKVKRRESNMYQRINFLDKSYSNKKCVDQIRKSRNCDHLKKQENLWTRRFKSQEINYKNDQARCDAQRKLRKKGKHQIKSRDLKDTTRNYNELLGTKYSFEATDQIKSHGAPRINEFYHSMNVKNKQHSPNYFRVQVINKNDHVKPIIVEEKICGFDYKSDGECTTSSEEYISEAKQL